MGVQCKARAAAKAGGLGKGRNAAMGRQGKREIAKLFRARSLKPLDAEFAQQLEILQLSVQTLHL
jgi:hypothetical protein